MRKVRLSIYTQECGRDSAHRIAVWFEREEARPSGYYYYRDDCPYRKLGMAHRSFCRTRVTMLHALFSLTSPVIKLRTGL
jgi:hypothetical protein